MFIAISGCLQIECFFKKTKIEAPKKDRCSWCYDQDLCLILILLCFLNQIVHIILGFKIAIFKIQILYILSQQFGSVTVTFKVVNITMLNDKKNNSRL